MTSLLNIALLLVGAGSTIAAFGGKTWEEGDKPLLERITARGWISLLCLILAVSIGAWKEIYSSKIDGEKDAASALATQRAKNDSDQKQADLKQQLATAQGELGTANAKLEGLKTQLKITEDQITGGNGFPVAAILWQSPDSDNSFPLRVYVVGKAPIYDVSFRIIEGAYKTPSPEELQKILQEAIAEANGHGTNPARYLGVLNPGYAEPMNYVIHPALTGTNTYRISFSERNGGVFDTLEVRFNDQLKIWQYRNKVISERAKNPNKVLLKEDWIPNKVLPALYGNGRPG